MTDVCTSTIKCFYDFQTLASGVLAVGAALIGGAYVLRSSRLPIEAQRQQTDSFERRKAAHISRVMAVEMTRIADLANQAASTIRVVVNSGTDVTEATRSKTTIQPPSLIDDVEAMSLMPAHLSRKALDLRHAVLRHNFDMNRAGGSFGDTNFQAHVHRQAEDLATTAKQISRHFHDHGVTLSQSMIEEE